MKKTLLLVLLFISGILFSTPLFSFARTELRITNKTGVQVKEVIVIDLASRREKTHYVALGKNESTTIRIRRGVRYDIFLVDVNRHRYEIRNRKWGSGRNVLEVSHRDFVHQDIFSTIRRIFGR
ncbi:MAG: hypothetical protein FWD87_10425 [Spirochaetaceae bacterium]|nr:hypothetical protein [Spirochaetaceae bacterium]